MVASTIGRPAARWVANADSANGWTIATSSSATDSAADRTAACERPLAKRDGLAGQRHGRQRLADRVEQPEHELLAGHRPRAQTGESAWRARRPRPRRPAAACGRDRRTWHRSCLSRPTHYAVAAESGMAGKTGKTRMGDPGLSTWEFPPMGDRYAGSLRVEHGGCSHCDLYVRNVSVSLVKVCT